MTTHLNAYEMPFCAYPQRPPLLLFAQAPAYANAGHVLLVVMFPCPVVKKRKQQVRQPLFVALAKVWKVAGSTESNLPLPNMPAWSVVHLYEVVLQVVC